MLRHVATVPLTFQRFPVTPGTSTRHGRDIEPAEPGHPGVRIRHAAKDNICAARNLFPQFPDSAADRVGAMTSWSEPCDH